MCADQSSVIALTQISPCRHKYAEVVLDGPVAFYRQKNLVMKGWLHEARAPFL
jgi:hypothetical protein